jgi:hypothetical protein
VSGAQLPEQTTQVETCRECGAPLAADQRYCLNCGRRRGEPRLDFRQHMSAQGAAMSGDGGGNGHAPAAVAPASAPGPAPEAKPQRDYTPLAAAGGIAVLGLMLLVGVLIGRGDGDQAAAPPPQVVRVQGGGEETASASDEEGPLGDAGTTKKAKGTGSGKGGAQAGGSGKAPPPEITADDSELEALEGKTGKDYSEAAANLPDEIATPGAAPPVDDKAPGGGSKGTAIE